MRLTGGGSTTMNPSILPVERQRQSRHWICPYCRDTLDGVASVKSCDGCQAHYHAQCWTELGGCATLGCEAQATRKAPSSEAAGPRSYAVQFTLGLIMTVSGGIVSALSVHAANDFSLFHGAMKGVFLSVVLLGVGLALLLPVISAASTWE